MNSLLTRQYTDACDKENASHEVIELLLEAEGKSTHLICM